MSGLRTLLIDNHPAFFGVATDPPVGSLLNYGVLGVFAVVLIYVVRLLDTRNVKNFEARLLEKDATIAKQDTIIAMFMQQGQQSVQVLQRNAQVIEALPKALPTTPAPADLEDIRQVLPRLLQIAERLESKAGDGEATS